MAKTKKRISSKNQEWDSVFILKLVLFIILGSQWLHIVSDDSSRQFSLPFGALLGLLFAVHDHFKIDRKIEYAVLLIAMFVGFWLPMGITLVK